MKKVKFLRRLKVWIKPNDTRYYDPQTYRIYFRSRAEVIEAALRGECYTFLRTTGRPCNCYMCSEYEKYVRESKQKIDKQIWQQITDDNN